MVSSSCVSSLLSVAFVIATTVNALPKFQGSQEQPIPLIFSPAPTTVLTMADLQQHELKLVNKELSLDFFNSTKTPVMRPPVDPDEGAVCFKNPTYAAGAAIWQYYANNYCRNRFPGDTSQILASGNPDEPVGTVDLSDRPNWFKLNFQIKVHPGIAVTEWVNQEKCMAGFTRVIDYAVRRWECDGYTGRQYGDGMGSWAGGNNEGASSGNSIAYYMWTSK